MLHLLADGLERFIRAELGATAESLDFSFDAPNREWSATLARPTVNCYLWDMGLALDETVAGMEMVEEDGRWYRRTPLPRVALRYLVTVWAEESRDEQRLLGALLTNFIEARDVPAEHLPAPLAAVEPLPFMRPVHPPNEHPADFWSALGGSFRPGLDLVVTATVDPKVRIELPRRPQQMDLVVVDRHEPGRRSFRSWFRSDPPAPAA